MIRLQYLPANQAYCFTFGDSILDMDGQRIFNTRREAKEAADRVGFFVKPNGEVK
jgi:hypothetical protein